MSLTRNFFIRFNRKTNYYSDYYFHYIFNKYVNLKYVSDVIVGESSANSLSSKEIISFRGNLEFGISEKNIRKKLGKPLFYFKNKKISNHSILFYKLQIGGFKMNVEVHLYNKIFFMGVYSFSNIRNGKGINKIEKILFEKYGIKRTESKVERPIIVDSRGNSIIINDDLCYSITYLSGNVFLLDSFQKDIQNIISQKKNNQAPLDRHLRRNL